MQFCCLLLISLNKVGIGNSIWNNLGHFVLAKTKWFIDKSISTIKAPYLWHPQRLANNLTIQQFLLF